MGSKKVLFGVLLLIPLIAVAGLWNVASAHKQDVRLSTATTWSYLVISPHTQDECLAALDATAAEGNATLAKWNWGCGSGDHTGYALVNASSESEALQIVPESLRAKAHAIKVTKLTADQIKAMHTAHP